MPLAPRTFAAWAACALTFTFTTPLLAGGGGACFDGTEVCEVCAVMQCATEAEACCGQTGCHDLALCLIDNCYLALGNQADVFGCAVIECDTELQAAGGVSDPPPPAVQAADAMTTCLKSATTQTPPPAGACTECADQNPLSGAGGGPTSGAGGSASVGGSSAGGSSASGSSAGGSSAGGSDGGASTTAPATSTGSGGRNEDEGGCTIGRAPEPTNPVGWFALVGLAALRLRRRRESAA